MVVTDYLGMVLQKLESRYATDPAWNEIKKINPLRVSLTIPGVNSPPDVKNRPIAMDMDYELSPEQRKALVPFIAKHLKLGGDDVGKIDRAYYQLVAQERRQYGTKLFFPTVDEFRVALNTDLSLPCSAYAQPFPSITIMIPEGVCSYVDVGVTDFNDEGKEVDRVDSVKYVQINLSRLSGGVLCGLLGTPKDRRGVVLSCDSFYLDAENSTFKEEMARVHAYRTFHGNNHYPYFKAALNYVLMVMSYKSRRIKNDPKELAEAEQQKAARSNREAKRTAAKAVASAPEYYELAQHIELNQKIAFESEDTGTVSGWKIKPHWRSAHWASQPYGPGSTLRKQILRPFVFVNPKDYDKDDHSSDLYEKGTELS